MRQKLNFAICCIIIFILLSNCEKVKPILPVVSTIDPFEIAVTTGKCGGNITSDGGALITSSGICWGTSPNVSIANSKTTDGSSLGVFTSDIVDLQSETTYYIRAYAANKAGTAYGEELNFKTFSAIDMDGNLYHSVKIDNQIWLNENLKSTKFNDGTTIPLITDDHDWAFLTSAAYCWYNNEMSYKSVYGAIYNGYSIKTNKLCPIGWHVPTSEEWRALVVFLGGSFSGGSKIKETGTTHWIYPNEATNETGFTALPGGYRTEYGNFDDILKSGYWWSSSELSGTLYSEYMVHDFNGIYLLSSYEQTGRSVRCIKN